VEKIYLDVCCLNRPFDDQTQERIRLEAEAVLLILNRFQQGLEHWVGSNTLVYEIRQTPDAERRRRVLSLLHSRHSAVEAETGEVARAGELQALGFKAVDSLHIVCAEKAGCAVLLTTDDRLLRAARRNAAQLRVRVVNPVTWLGEESES